MTNPKWNIINARTVEFDASFVHGIDLFQINWSGRTDKPFWPVRRYSRNLSSKLHRGNRGLQAPHGKFIETPRNGDFVLVVSTGPLVG
jgi:hypothetical protein